MKKIIYTLLITSFFWFLAFNLYLGITEEFPKGYLDKYTVSECIITKECGDELLRKQCPNAEIEGNKIDVTPFLQLIKAQTNRIACLKNKCISWESYECK